jgi:fructokinase
MFDVISIGELLIDFTPAGTDGTGDALFARKPGGAPANVVCAVAKLGGNTSFIGKVGRDAFGDFLERTLSALPVDTNALFRDPSVPTTLAFVQLDATGNRSFSFYRKPGADLMLSPEDVATVDVSDCSIFHFGSVSLTGEPSRSATLAAVKRARKTGCIVSYDPNYRPLLWPDPETAKREMLAALPLADIVKVSDEELPFLAGTDDPVAGAETLAAHGAALVIVSLGARGAYVRSSSLRKAFPTYAVKTVDTTGAGDAFLGALLYQLRGLNLGELRNLSDDKLVDIVGFANAAGALATTKYGAIPALPTLAEIESFRTMHRY